MTDEGQIHVPTRDRWSLPALAVALISIVLPILGVIWWVAGWAGAVAALSAMMSCGAGVMAGWVAASMFAQPQVLERMGAGMILRMFVPLGIFLVLYQTSPALVTAGLAYYMIAIYLSMLAFETFVTVRRLQSWDSTEGVG